MEARQRLGTVSLTEDLENVHNWLRANKLTLNMTKSEFMLIGSRKRLSTVRVSPTLAITDFRVTLVATAKTLGVISLRSWRYFVVVE